MPAKPIRINGIRVFPHKAVASPVFGAKTVLVRDTWDYVELSLRRRSADEPLFYWKQARTFAQASAGIDKLAFPLTAYYAILNATKALLSSRGVSFDPYHGLSGQASGNRAALSNQIVKLQATGVLPAMLNYLGVTGFVGTSYSLSDVFYNLPFIHRAYCSTYASRPEILLPIKDPHFVVKEGSSEAWFNFTVRDDRMQNAKTVKMLDGFEHDKGIGSDFVLRQKKRFFWDEKTDPEKSHRCLINAHQKLRIRCVYIAGLTRLWYMKLSKPNKHLLDLPTLGLMFMALHRLSELARYTPQKLDSLFSSNANWVLSEFLSLVLPQFIDECSAEITGYDTMPPGIHL